MSLNKNQCLNGIGVQLGRTRLWSRWCLNGVQRTTPSLTWTCALCIRTCILRTLRHTGFVWKRKKVQISSRFTAPLISGEGSLSSNAAFSVDKLRHFSVRSYHNRIIGVFVIDVKIRHWETDVLLISPPAKCSMDLEERKALFSACALIALLPACLTYYVPCDPCDPKALSMCPPVPTACQAVKEPGCGCCLTCALREGHECGVYTGTCAAGLRCLPRVGEEKPLHALLHGKGMCMNEKDYKPATGEFLQWLAAVLKWWNREWEHILFVNACTQYL